MIRWALRLSRREWRQQILVALLLAAPVALTIVGTAVGVNAPSSPDATFGSASKILSLPGSGPRLASDIAAIRRIVGTIDVIENQDLATGTAQPVELRAQDPHGAYGQPMLSLLSGHYPAGPGQVAATGGVASLFGLRIGGWWHHGGRAWRVTGLVEKPSRENAPSNYAVIGRYVLRPEIFDILEKTPPGKGGEIQLTDALEGLATAPAWTGGVHGVVFRGRRYDTGDRLDYLKAIVQLAVARDDLGPELLPWLRDFAANAGPADTGAIRALPAPLEPAASRLLQIAGA